MPSFKDIFKSSSSSSEKRKSNPPPSPATPEFTFIRSDTTTQTVIHPPTGFPDDNPAPAPAPPPPSSSKRRSSLFPTHRRNKSTSSVHLPNNLPSAHNESDWEKRATILVGTGTPSPAPRSRANSIITSDNDLQTAIQLHESGNYEPSTRLFRRLADEDDNPLSQVLYGLSLRHGWGIAKDESLAVQYLKRAAQNSAAVESEALKAGLKKGGVAKGELTLAIYELANSYRNGWGVEKDAAAAREYYETAAHLGDADAQNEAGWCYVNGFGCRKDKKKAAGYYRMAEKQGVKIPGNSWIYKDKYMDGEED